MKTRTLYKSRVTCYNEVFDPETGTETLSFCMHPDTASDIAYASEQEDAKGTLKYYACCWLGRAADLERCTGLAIRELDDGRIEFRLRFGPPWYWRQLCEHYKRAAREGTAEPRTVGAFQ